MTACGSCRFFRVHSHSADGIPIGDCRHQPQRGDFGPEAPTCISFLSVDAPIPQKLPELPSRRRSSTTAGGRHPVPASIPAPILRRHTLSPAGSTPEPVELSELTDMTREDLKSLFAEVLAEADRGEVQLAPKWEGGVVVLRPHDPQLKPHEVPIDQLLHKVVMVRDRLRVLEQKINGNEKLSDAEKVDLQQYITRCYGSLTSFNLLFRDKGDHFVGERGGE